MDHALVRQIEKWGSRGKYHNEPLTWRFIKDLSDSHLLHILVWVYRFDNNYSTKVIQMIEDEVTYRSENYIFVPDY